MASTASKLINVRARLFWIVKQRNVLKMWYILDIVSSQIAFIIYVSRNETKQQKQ